MTFGIEHLFISLFVILLGGIISIYYTNLIFFVLSIMVVIISIALLALFGLAGLVLEGIVLTIGSLMFMYC